MNAFPEGKAYNINGQVFNFSVATRTLDLVRGLSGVASLDPYDGMLFDFGYEMSVAMTPRGLKFPVQVAFISEWGEIKQIETLDPIFGSIQQSYELVRYALEVPVGFFERNGLSVGDTIL